MAKQTASERKPIDGENKRKIAPKILSWYDHHARDLPWRVSPQACASGILPDPYHVWLSEIMLQQTTVATVAPRFGAFVKRWPTVNDMSAAQRDDILAAWAGLGYYARARNLHACAQIIANDLGGVFPDTEDQLRALPGIGDYTAAAITAIAFNRKAIVMDGNIERVTARLFAEAMALPGAKPTLKKLTALYWPEHRHGDFAQGLMDLASSICRPKNPHCDQCPVKIYCSAQREGHPERYPRKAPKKVKPTRRGMIFVIADQKGQVAVERRPDKGLLGGMSGFPGSDWVEGQSTYPLSPDLKTIGANATSIGEVSHTFTHFHLRLKVHSITLKSGNALSDTLKWCAPETLSLPTVMRKVLDCWLAQTR